MGVSLIDTARSYGLSEERIGRHLADRRDAFTLCTKVGYGVEGLPDWTSACVAAGIDRALRGLRTDRIDVVLLHSCPVQLLEQGDVIEPLERARAAGKIRAAGYSGDGEPLARAVQSNRFDVVECSVSLLDRAALACSVPAAAARGIGVLAKRPLATAPFELLFDYIADPSELRNLAETKHGSDILAKMRASI